MTGARKKHLILFGLPLLNPTEQVLQYAVYRAVISRRTAVKDARDWLLDELNAEIAETIWRLRAVQRSTENLLVEIYGFMPIVGHGLKVDEIRMEAQGRLHKKTRARAVIAQGVVDLGESRTRAKLVDYFKREKGSG